MLKWFRDQPSPYRAALAMIGAKTADRVLAIGASHPRLAAELALTTGLNGETLVLCTEADRAAVEAASTEAGSLVDVAVQDDADLGLEGREFDVIVWMEPLALRAADVRLARMRQAFTLLRPGGRVIVIDGTLKAGLLKRPTTSSLDAATIVPLLASCGGLAARDLGTIEGLTYYEARKTRT